MEPFNTNTAGNYTDFTGYLYSTFPQVFLNSCYKTMTNDQKRIDIIAKLTKDGHISFEEAIDLLMVEVRVEYRTQYIDRPYPQPLQWPYLQPYVITNTPLPLGTITFTSGNLSTTNNTLN